ncbi:thioredoxin family protein [Flagellimonas hymeniacidonis]|uniref:Thioredoxin family protein n=1 Tax=Flagellimonas hymeniacidonis TaxID=2603628 RepID=A0A5C8V1R5_9FLAO|nr:thioredoxin family protein [Flagellimonas hymeniacidonis]TXN35012.1 thioredoxin family protein [Flagellimonas hymeniacidonis]
MKHLFFIVCCLFFGSLHAQQWQESFDDAVKLANEEDKPIVLVFSGSDWCPPCIRLKRNILDSEDFKAYASSHYIMYNADFPRKKKNLLPLDKLNANKSLAEKYNPKGHFPLVVVMNKQEMVLGKTGFDRKASPEKYISKLNSFVK